MCRREDRISCRSHVTFRHKGAGFFDMLVAVSGRRNNIPTGKRSHQPLNQPGRFTDLCRGYGDMAMCPKNNASPPPSCGPSVGHVQCPDRCHPGAALQYCSVLKHPDLLRLIVALPGEKPCNVALPCQSKMPLLALHWLLYVENRLAPLCRKVTAPEGERHAHDGELRGIHRRVR